MNDIAFHQTRMGRDFYDRTVPELVRQLARLNELLERVVAALETRPTRDEEGR